jgi:DNA-binding transcriptional ArsR family regulator
VTGGASISTLRIAGRLANAFTLELVKLGGHRREVVDALLRAAILHSNLAHHERDEEFQRRYAALDADPPDEARRPATVNAIATSLRLPFETVRRRVNGLIEGGVCASTPSGVIVPQALTSSEPYRRNLIVQYEKLQDLYRRLHAIGVLQAPPPAEPWTGEAPVRLAGRLVVEFVLRFVEAPLEHVGHPVTTITGLEIILANTEKLPDDEAGRAEGGVDSFVPDARRQPVGVSQLAARLGMSGETIRRHVKRLEAAGLCRKVPGGYIVPAAALAQPVVMGFAARNLINLTRMYAALADYGVLAAWEAKRHGRAVDGAA